MNCCEYRIPSSDDGIHIYVKRKYTKISKENPIIICHGASWSPSTVYDLKLTCDVYKEVSFMDLLALAGYDVYYLDYRVMGKSGYPDWLLKTNNQIGKTSYNSHQDCVNDLKDVIDFFKLDKVHLIGWSTGTSVISMYHLQNKNKVKSLMLHGPKNRKVINEFLLPLFVFTKDSLTNSAPFVNKRAGKNPNYIKNVPLYYIKTWWDAILNSTKNPIVCKGMHNEMAKTWCSGIDLFKIEDITCPTMVVSGDYDDLTPIEDCREVFNRISSEKKEFYVCKSSGHYSAIEPKRAELLAKYLGFLEVSVD